MKFANSRNNEVKNALLREKERSRLISERFPDVVSIVIKMNYRSDGATSLKRTLKYYPENRAFFKVNCLSDGCEKGGLNLTRIINSVIKRHLKGDKGNLRCTHRNSDVVHALMSYEVSIKYAS